MTTELPHPATEDIELSAVLAALADPARLTIVRELAEAEPGSLACQGVGGDVAKSTRSHQLKILREAGVTVSRQAGRERRVSLRRADLEQRFPGLLEAVLAGARSSVSTGR